MDLFICSPMKQKCEISCLTTKTDRLKSVIAYSVGIIYYSFSISLSSAHIVWIYSMPVSVCAVSVVCVCVRDSHDVQCVLLILHITVKLIFVFHQNAHIN